MAQLRQVRAAEWSNKAACQDQYDRLTAVFRQGYLLSSGIEQFKIRC
jgi:hypothetical protein